MRNGDTRDERTVSVENSSYRWGYIVLAYGILASAAYRGLLRHESSWDLFALVIASGVVTTLYQARLRVLSRRWAVAAVAAIALAALLAAGIGLIR